MNANSDLIEIGDLWSKVEVILINDVHELLQIDTLHEQIKIKKQQEIFRQRKHLHVHDFKDQKVSSLTRHIEE